MWGTLSSFALITILFFTNLTFAKTQSQTRPNGVPKNPTGGYLVNPKKFPNVFDLTMSDGFYCTGALIGPQVILTAEHCANTPETTGKFKHNGKNYNFTFHSHKKIAMYDLDIAVGLLDKPIHDLEYYSIPNSFEHGRKFIALGYGCSGDKLGQYFLVPQDKKLDTNADYLTPLVGNLKEMMALCGGDSGGPVLAYDYSGKLQLVGLNLMSNRVFLTEVLLLNKTWVRSFFAKAAEQLKIEICGINRTCS